MRAEKLGINLVVASAVALFAASAAGQDAPPADPPTTSGPAVAAPPPADATAPSTGLPAPGTAPAAAETPDEPSYPPAWFRIDSDGAGLQLWAGATHPLGDSVGLATDIYVYSGPVGEFDIGPAITAGDFVLTPMLGIVFDWGAKRAASLVPQFYAVGGPDPIYFELWSQLFLNSVFVDDADNQLYLRLFADYEVSEYFAFGPQIEALLNVSGDGDTTASLPVGGNVMLTNYGAGNTLLLFLGYETKEDARQVVVDDETGETEERGLVGRLTFIKNF